MIEIQTDQTVQAAQAEMRAAPALFAQLVTKSVGRTVKAGRANLVRLLADALAVRWRSIIKRRARFKFLGAASGIITLTGEEMRPTSFRGKWSGGGAYTVQVLKEGYNIIVPEAFKGKGIDGRFRLFTRDPNATPVRQTMAHYRKNIGRLRKPSKAVPSITMMDIVAKKPAIVTQETAFLDRTFSEQMQAGANKILGGKR